MKHSLAKIIKSGWTNFKRNTYLSIAVTGVMGLVLIVMLSLLSFQFLSSRLVATLQEKVDISAYFKIETTEDIIDGVKADLEKLPEVKSVMYISREQASEEFAQRHADNPLIQESLLQLDDNPFEATLNITALDSTKYEAVAVYLENSSQRDMMSKINYNENKDVIDRINHVATAIRNWGFAGALVIAIIAILITFNTVRLTIYNQKQEIEIMRLVGASNWFIRGPFIVEGILYGLAGALVTAALVYPILFILTPKISSFLELDITQFNYLALNYLALLGILLAIGSLLGIVSSATVVRKYLKI